jgi:hypothetical protein
MKKVVKIKRKEIQRHFRGMYFYQADGFGKCSYAQAVYEVTYACTQGKKSWFETKSVTGEPIYTHEHPIHLAHAVGNHAVCEILSYMEKKGIQ